MVSAIAYAESLAATIIIEAIVSLNDHLLPVCMPIFIASRFAALALTLILAVAGSRSIAASAVMIFTVLAGGSAVCMLRAVITAPVPASTRMNACGGGV